MMTTHYNTHIAHTIDEYKQKNEQYQKLIDKQKVTIKSLRASITHLVNENEILMKRNKELENTLIQSSVYEYQDSNSPTKTAVKSIPVPPPRSPYRNNTSSQEKTQTQFQKRPPVLNLVKSNHAPHQQMEMTDSLKTDYPFSPNRYNASSSPSSSTSTSSSDRQSIESDQFYLTSPKHHYPSPSSPRHKRSYQDIPTTPLIQHLHPSKSEPTTPALPRTPRTDSLPQSDESNSLTHLSNIEIKIIHYDIDRHKKSSLNEYHFLIGIFQKESANEIWRVEKSFNELIYLDAKLRELNPFMASHLKSLPDKSLFLSSSPSKISERKNMIEEYLRHAIFLNCADNQPLHDFLSTNKVYDASKNISQNTGIIKQGYLIKKKRNSGGWKTRYFILDHHGSFKYYENVNGHFLGSINLSSCQIISDTQPEIDQINHYKHTFILLEQKTSTTFTKHSFSASSHEEKQSWIRHIQSISDMSLFTSSSNDRRRRSHYHKPIMDTSIDFSHDRSLGPRRKSSTAIPNPSFHIDGSLKTISSIDEYVDESAKKTKQKHHRKTFWPIRMFGHHQTDEIPVSPNTSEHQQSDNEDGEKQVFGIPLEEVVSKSRVNDQYDLPAIVYRCIVYIEAKNGLDEEGIYRQSGSTLEVKALKKQFNDHGDVNILENGEFHDIHAVVGLLKMWLRELPENILTEAILGDLVQNTRMMDKQSMLIELGNLVSTLPLANYTLLRFLCAHLIRVIENSDTNKMTLKNISIIFSVTLGIPSNVFNMLLLEFDYIFWTNRCDDNQITEKTLKMYMESIEDLSLDQSNLEGRSSRNSVHYQEKTPKEFMALERQLQGAVQEDAYDEESYLSDGELEVAYYASRYNANSTNNVF